MHFGATLRMLRTDAGLSLRDLAELVGVSNAYLSRVENGHDAPPTPDRLSAIARALGLPPTILFELVDRVGPIAASVLENVPGARDLFVDILRRDLDAVQIAKVRAYIEREFGALDDVPPRRSIARLLAPHRVVLGFSGSDVEDVVDVAATRLAEDADVSVAAASQAILTRERESPTILGCGFAVPHAVGVGTRAAAAMVLLRKPMRVETPDGAPLRVFFVHLHPRGGREHLEGLVRLARVATTELADALCAATSPREAMRVLESAVL